MGDGAAPLPRSRPAGLRPRPHRDTSCSGPPRRRCAPAWCRWWWPSSPRPRPDRGPPAAPRRRGRRRAGARPDRAPAHPRRRRRAGHRDPLAPRRRPRLGSATARPAGASAASAPAWRRRELGGAARNGGCLQPVERRMRARDRPARAPRLLRRRAPPRLVARQCPRPRRPPRSISTASPPTRRLPRLARPPRSGRRHHHAPRRHPRAAPPRLRPLDLGRRTRRLDRPALAARHRRPPAARPRPRRLRGRPLEAPPRLRHPSPRPCCCPRPAPRASAASS